MAAADSLFCLLRDGFEEISIEGEIVVCDGGKVLYQSSELMGSYPARSLLKPIQFLAAGIPAERWTGKAAAERYTACMGSISATAAQVEKLKQWYVAPELQKLMGQLRVPAIFPMDEKLRVSLKSEGKTPHALFHTCFSKHMAILEGCEAQGWELASYRSEKHPFHRKLLKTLSELLGENLEDAVSVTDGCGLPSPVLTMSELARLYQRLANAGIGTPLALIRDLMASRPEWIGGPGRTDTRLMTENPGKLVAKEGADGLIALAVFPTAEYPAGLGISLKLSAGYLPQYFGLALRPLLEKLGLQSVGDVPKGQEIRYDYLPMGKNVSDWIDISPLVGEETAVWPGDKNFRRHESLSTLLGHHYTLSSIETTVHIGAHADAPSHYLKVTQGIDDVDVEKYVGPCQVIEVARVANGVIKSEHLGGTKIVAPRVLFKTGSFPEPSKFNLDFMALSSELIRYLQGFGVVLVGIDTPSIDPFDSKELPSHLAIGDAGMANLEGLVLDGVQPGAYELVAAPLKLRNADASPVRALLKKC